MTDPIEPFLQRTRHRSPASSKYHFEFIGQNESAVFPVLQRTTNGILRLIGTGFFVAPGSIFATAKHIFEGDDISESDYFEVSQVVEDDVVRRDITHIHSHTELDIAICKLGPPEETGVDYESHPIVGVMEDDPIILDDKYEVLGSFVYAQTLVHDPEPDTTGKYGGDDTQLLNRRGHWEKGYIEEIHAKGLRKVGGRCFSTSIFVEGRASGGPVFNSSGFAVGINSSGFAPPDGLPFSTISSILGAMAMSFQGPTVAERRSGLPNNPIVKVTPLKK